MFRLVKNASTVLTNNLMFLGVVIFVPFTLGRAVLYHVSWWLFAAARGPTVTASMPFTDTGVSLVNIIMKRALTSVSILTNEGQENGLLGQLTEMMKSKLNGGNNTLSAAAHLLKGSDVTTLDVGYMFIVFLVLLQVEEIWMICFLGSFIKV